MGENIMKKILYKSDPIMSSYSTLGNITSVLNGLVPLEPWLYNHFIQLSIEKIFRFSYQKIMYHDCPFIKAYSIPKVYISNIITFLENSINENYYAFFLVDRFYLQSYKEYHKEHVIHEIFIYGYDKERKEFYTSDNSTCQKYMNKLVKYDDLDMAYYVVGKNFMYLSEVLIDYTVPQINMDLIRGSVGEYIDSKCCYGEIGFSNNYSYGVDVYNHFVRIMNENNEYERKNFVYLHLFWEHKKLMLDRIKYLVNNAYINCDNRQLESYEDITRKFLFLRNLQIRYALCENASIISELTNRLPGLVTNEIKILQDVFKI